MKYKTETQQGKSVKLTLGSLKKKSVNLKKIIIKREKTQITIMSGMREVTSLQCLQIRKGKQGGIFKTIYPINQFTQIKQKFLEMYKP